MKRQIKTEKCKFIFRGTSGQGVLEYIIISGLIGIFCLVAVKQFGAVIQKRISYMKETIVKNMPVNQ